MTDNATATKKLSIARLIMFDIVVALLSCAVFIKSHVSWDIGIVLLVLVVAANIFVVFRGDKIERWTSIHLTILYGCCSIGAIVWCIFSFSWWKLLVIAFPLVSFVKYANKLKTNRVSEHQ